MAVICPNAASDPHYIYRVIGASGLTTGELSLIWQQLIVADIPASFQTYSSLGPVNFLSNPNDYEVCFDGNGTPSDASAVGGDGSDVYSSSNPVIGVWKRMGLRVVSTGGNNQDHIFYYDLEAGTANKVTISTTSARVWGSDMALVFSSNRWSNDGEGTNGKYRYGWLFERLLTEADLQTQSGSSSLLISGTSLWGQWPLNTDLLDVSGNARHLTNQGTVTFEPDTINTGSVPRMFHPGRGLWKGARFFQPPRGTALSPTPEAGQGIQSLVFHPGYYPDAVRRRPGGFTNVGGAAADLAANDPALVLTTAGALTTGIPLLANDPALVITTAGALTTAIPLQANDGALVISTAGVLTTAIRLLANDPALAIATAGALTTAIQLAANDPALVIQTNADLTAPGSGGTPPADWLTLFRRRR